MIKLSTLAVDMTRKLQIHLGTKFPVVYWSLTCKFDLRAVVSRMNIFGFSNFCFFKQFVILDEFGLANHCNSPKSL